MPRADVVVIAEHVVRVESVLEGHQTTELRCAVKCFDVHRCVVGGEVHIRGAQPVRGQRLDRVAGPLAVKVVLAGLGPMGGVVDHESRVPAREAGTLTAASGGAAELEDSDEAVRRGQLRRLLN